MQPKSGTAALAGGALAAIAASVCCLGPLVLVMLGIGGAWVANLTAFEPYRPVFIGMALVFLGFAYRRIYKAAAGACAPGVACAASRVPRGRKILFWSASALVLLAIVFPYLVPFFY